jgi:high-affinity nickel-transport protein
MDQMPATWTALCALAFTLGVRHGLDADHLATVDGLTRCNAREHPGLARFAGALFSLGHGAVVIVVALVAGSVATAWQPPSWLELTGVAVSVAFLFGLALVNVRAVLVSDPGTIVSPAGLKARLLGRVFSVHRPWAVSAVGAMFALSFDTVSQAALFALAAGRFGGLAEALFVASLFVLGMVLVDGINGAWISRLIRRADATAAIASRVMALSVAGISVTVGGFALTKLLLPGVAGWAEGRELLLGAAVVAGVLTAFAAAMIAARRPAAISARSRA